MKMSIKEFRYLASSEIVKFKNVRKVCDSILTVEIKTRKGIFEEFNVYYLNGRYTILNQNAEIQAVLISSEVI